MIQTYLFNSKIILMICKKRLGMVDYLNQPTLVLAYLQSEILASDPKGHDDPSPYCGPPGGPPL